MAEWQGWCYEFQPVNIRKNLILLWSEPGKGVEVAKDGEQGDDSKRDPHVAGCDVGYGGGGFSQQGDSDDEVDAECYEGEEAGRKKDVVAKGLEPAAVEDAPGTAGAAAAGAVSAGEFVQGAFGEGAVEFITDGNEEKHYAGHY